ncbi:hypothetical protein Q7P35_000409 [Cladosporium inversicolor]
MPAACACRNRTTARSLSMEDLREGVLHAHCKVRRYGFTVGQTASGSFVVMAIPSPRLKTPNTIANKSNPALSSRRVEYIIGGKCESRRNPGGREGVKKPSAGALEQMRNDPRSQPSPALSARCAGNPPRIETPIRGWEKALIRQFFEEELRCASAASSHESDLTTERGSRVICVMRVAVVSPTQRTNCGNMGPLRIFRVLRA